MASRSKKAKLRRMEQQDALGVSRKKPKYAMQLDVFVIIKLANIALIVIFYFVYSPLLFLLISIYAATFFAAIATEKGLNRSVIKSQHITVPKFDCAVALVVAVIAICGGFTTLTAKTEGKLKDFAPPGISSSQNGLFADLQSRMKYEKLLRNFKQFGSCLTGERSIFENDKKFKFGGVEPPDGIGDGQTPDFPPDGKRPKISVSDLPLSYVVSSTLSTVCTVLIFGAAGMGLLTLLSVYRTKKKRDEFMSVTVISGKIQLLSDEKLDAILSFGEDPENPNEGSAAV